MEALLGFGVTAKVEEFNLGNRFGKEADGCVGAKILFEEKQPKSITITLKTAAHGTTPLIVYCEEPDKMRENQKFSFDVPISVGSVWPVIADPHQDERSFANVLLYDQDVHLIDAQISVVDRNGELYLMIQKVWQGWERKQGDEIIFVPSASAYARPGLNYEEQWPARGKIFAMFAEVIDEITTILGHSLSAPEPATWDYPPTSNNGRTIVKVAHFCHITDSGLGVDSDGTEYQLFGKNLYDIPGPVKMLPSGTLLTVKALPRKEGATRTYAANCRPYKG